MVNLKIIPEEMTQQLGTLVLAKDIISVPSTLFWPLQVLQSHAHTLTPHIHIAKNKDL